MLAMCKGRLRNPKLEIAASLILLLCLAGPVFADEIPATLRPNWPNLTTCPSDVPVWVAAKAAFDEEGDLIPSLFLDESRWRLQRLFRIPKDPATGCAMVRWIDPSYVNPPNRSSLAEAVASSEMVIWGKVVASEPGFERGQVGQLLMVQPLEILKGETTNPPAFYYAFVPKGRFRFAGYDICKEDPRMVAPEVGGEVVLFPYKAPAGESYLNLEYEGSLITFDAEGRVEWPQSMAVSDTHARIFPTPASVLEETRAAARRGKP